MHRQRSFDALMFVPESFDYDNMLNLINALHLSISLTGIESFCNNNSLPHFFLINALH
jgi:hypothetical protein